MELPEINTEKLIECLQESNNAIARMVKRIYPAIANVKVPKILSDISEIFSENEATFASGCYANNEVMDQIRCKFDARSPYLKCAVNPTGDCASCQHFEKE